MKQILLSALLVALSVLPLAAQPEDKTPILDQPDRAPQTAVRQGKPKDYLDADAKAFVEKLNTYGVWYGEANPTVLNAKAGFFGMNEWVKWWRTQIATPQGQLKFVSAELQNITPENVATVQVKIWREDYERIETLRLHWNAKEKRWQIEAQRPAKDEHLGSAPLRWAAYMAAQPKGAVDDFYAALSAQNLKRCALGVFQFTQDFEQQFAFSPDFWQKAIRPYTHDDQAYLQPDTKKPYSFNSFLSERNLGDLKESYRTIMFYEGEMETLRFRENGLTTVCFADGHIELIDRKQAKELIWKP